MRVLQPPGWRPVYQCAAHGLECVHMTLCVCAYMHLCAWGGACACACLRGCACISMHERARGRARCLQKHSTTLRLGTYIFIGSRPCCGLVMSARARAEACFLPVLGAHQKTKRALCQVNLKKLQSAIRSVDVELDDKVLCITHRV